MTILHNLVSNRNFRSAILHEEKIMSITKKGSPLVLCDISTSIINFYISSNHVLWVQFGKHGCKGGTAKAAVCIFFYKSDYWPYL